jgi:flagellar basal body-associated protein FliL
LFDVLKITSTSVARGGWVVSALVVVQIVLLATTIGAFAFMLSSLWATLRVTFVGVPESAPEEDQAEESTDVHS